MPLSALRSRLPLQKFAQRFQWRVDRSHLARLTIVSQYYPPDFAATGQYIADLSIRLAERGLQNLVLTGQPGYAFCKTHADRIEFHPNRCIRRTAASRFWPERIRGRVINSLLFCLRTTLRLLRQARRGDLLLFTTEPAYLPIVGWFIHLLTRAPYVVLVYDLYPDIVSSLGVADALHPIIRLWRQLQTRALGAACEVVVLSTSMQQHIRSHYPDVLTPITVIPSWADPDFIKPIPKNNNPFVANHSLSGFFIVLYSGNQGRCHDLKTLLDTAELLLSDPSILFLIVGSGAQHRELVQSVHERRLTNIRFLPFQESDQLPLLLASADLAIVSLLRAAEGMVAPSKLYGHLAAANPIAAICSPSSYLRTEISRAGCGSAFDSGDSYGLSSYIVELSLNPERAKQLGFSGRRYLQSCATPSIVVQAYAQLLARHLPLNNKSYATPLHQDSEPLPDPSRDVPVSTSF